MTDDELIALICIRIGMIMEDICSDAVMVRADDGEQLRTVVAKLEQASQRISSLVHAASILTKHG